MILATHAEPAPAAISGRHATVVPLHHPAAAAGWAAAPIILPPPRTEFGCSLSKALQARHSIRDFDATRKLPPQVLSELLWCAYGINRPQTGDRTAPSWRHACETEILLAMEDGVWRYDPVQHRLLPHLPRDVRGETGSQPFPSLAPLDLIYVANRNHLAAISPEEQYRVASTDAGFIGENVYLYCASEGLATVFRASYDPGSLARILGLRWTQFFLTFVQTVGYPKA